QGAQAFAQQRRDNQYRQDSLQLDRDRLGQAAQEHEDRVAQWKEENKINKQNADSSTKNADTNARLASVSEGNLAIAQAAESRAATEFSQKQAELGGEDTFALGHALGYYNPGESQYLKVDTLASDLQSGANRQTDRFSLAALNNTPRAEGFTFTAIDRTTVPGKAIVRGRYKDGREGVMTAQGGIQEGEEVIALDFDQAAKLISNEFPTIGITALGGQAYAELMAKEGLNREVVNARTQAAEQQTAVVKAVDATGDVGMARAFRSALAAAKTEQERQEILTDVAQTMGVEYNPPVATPRDQIVDYQAPSGAYAKNNSVLGVDQRQIKGSAARGRITVLDRKTAKLEEKAKGQSGRALEKTNSQLDEIYNERQALVDERNNESLRLIDGEIADLQARFDKAAPARKEFWQGKLDEKNAKRDEIRTALGEITPAMQTDAYKQLETQLFTRLEGMSKQEIDALVDSGELPFSPEQVAVMRQRAQEAGIQKPSDIQKLPSQERLGYYALLSTIAQDPNQREAFRNENANLLETGTTSMSAKDVDISQRDFAKIQNTLYSNVTSRMAEERQARGSSTESMRRAGELASEISTAAQGVFFDEDGEFKSTLESARNFAQTLPSLQAKAAQFTPGSPEFDLINASVSSAVSNIVAAYVNDGDAGTIDGLYSFFFRDDPNGQMSDFNLSRVIVDDPENPTKLMYLGPGGRVVQGAEMSLTGLQEIDNNVYNIVRKQAIENARKRL
ncbi:MAG: hypothetical protein CL581_16205, partial [Alteromonadaceae bacterium]|nr:hypothetical protein [Alteromonadaceae bacterium]